MRFRRPFGIKFKHLIPIGLMFYGLHLIHDKTRSIIRSSNLTRVSFQRDEKKISINVDNAISSGEEFRNYEQPMNSDHETSESERETAEYGYEMEGSKSANVIADTSLSNLMSVLAGDANMEQKVRVITDSSRPNVKRKPQHEILQLLKDIRNDVKQLRAHVFGIKGIGTFGVKKNPKEISVMASSENIFETSKPDLSQLIGGKSLANLSNEEFLSIFLRLQNVTTGSQSTWTDLLEKPKIEITNIKTVEEGVNMYDLNQTENANQTQLCPLIPENLVGMLGVDTSVKSWQELHILHQNDILLGGKNHPQNCTARHRVALIVPYRNREENLKAFLHHMLPILNRQNLDYGIYVIHQADNQTYNKAMSLNIGFIEATQEKLWDCIIFHDIDLLPENDEILYNCPKSPRHLSSAPRNHGYKLEYEYLVGGVLAFKVEDFLKVNGYSNQFWGWGGEDDDMWNRLVYHNMTIQRYVEERGRFFNLHHRKSEKSQERLNTLKKGRDLRDKDGLSNIKYTMLDKLQHPLHTEIKVTYNHIEIESD